MTANPQGKVDPLDFTDVLERRSTSGPKASLYIPTDATGAQAPKSAMILKNQVKNATARFEELGMSRSDAESAFAPIGELIADSSYWRLQSRGLVVFVEPGYHRAVRIPINVSESVTVDEQFDILPLAPVLETNGKCYILALAKNSLRLFDATRNSIEELPLGTIPESFDEVVGDLPEQSLQFRSIGGGEAAYYGQGGADDTESMLTEKFIRAVGNAVGDELGTARSQPLVLAAVAEYLPIFRKACAYPVIHDRVIPGSPEQSLPDDLRSAAWKLLHDSETARESAARERALSLVHNGKGSVDVGEIAHAAEQGRVDTLHLPRDGEQLLASDARRQVNLAALATIGNSGSLRTFEGEGTEVIATFRY